MHCHAYLTCDATTPSRDPTQTAHVDHVDLRSRLSLAPAEPLCCGSGTTTARPLADTTERRLLEAISAGSRSALHRLHSLYFPRLAKFFAHLTATSAPDLVEELITDTMFDVWRASATFGSESSVHVAIMRLAWARGSKRFANTQALRPLPEALRPSPVHLSGGRDRATWLSSPLEAPPPLSEVLGTLTVAGRAVIHLVHHGHSRQEVADILSMSCESVDACLVSSMITLRPRLVSRCSYNTGDS